MFKPAVKTSKSGFKSSSELGGLTISNGTGFWSDNANIAQGLRTKVTYLSQTPDVNNRYPVEIEVLAIADNVDGPYAIGSFEILFDSNSWMPLPDDASANTPHGALSGSISTTGFDSASAAIINGHAARNSGSGATAGFIFHCKSDASTAAGNKISSIAKVFYDTLEKP